MPITITACVGVLLLIVGFGAWMLHRKGKRFWMTREQRETEEGLEKAFGKNMKWGYPGATENDLHDHIFSDSSSGSDGSGLNNVFEE